MSEASDKIVKFGDIEEQNKEIRNIVARSANVATQQLADALIERGAADNIFDPKIFELFHKVDPEMAKEILRKRLEHHDQTYQIVKTKLAGMIENQQRVAEQRERPVNRTIDVTTVSLLTVPALVGLACTWTGHPITGVILSLFVYMMLALVMILDSDFRQRFKVLLGFNKRD